MPRLLTFVRWPVTWLVLACFVLWLWYLRATVPPPPAHTVQSGLSESHGWLDGSPSTWATVLDVAEDGSRVTVEVVRCPGKWYTYTDTRPHVFDTRTGEDRTPRRWVDPTTQPITRPGWGLVQGSELWGNPAGRAFLADEDVWTTLLKRFRWDQEQADGGQPEPFGSHVTLSPDGRVLAYCSRDGRPAGLGAGDGTTVEDIRTGHRVAFLPGATDVVALAPGGRTAVIRLFPRGQDGERPQLALWDLETSTVRAELPLPEDHHTVRFSPDGRFVFARYSLWGKSLVPQLRWWETATGRRVGQVDNTREFAVMAGGSVLVTKLLPPQKAAVEESYRLLYWDVTTGAAAGEWDLGAPADGGGLYDLVGSDGGRYLVAVFDPEYGRGRSLAGRASDRMHALTVGGPAPDRRQIVVWDTSERREVARVPGKSAALSSNGRWVASVDPAGVVRVWEVPARTPWTHQLGWAAVAGVVSGLGMGLAWRCARSVGPRLQRMVGWIGKERRRQGWAAAFVLGVVVVISGGAAYLSAAAQARAELLAVYEQVSDADGMTEAEVANLVGRPADAGTVGAIVGRKKGGTCGAAPGPTTLRKWSRYGTELDVYFGEGGKARSVFISDPLPLAEQVAYWLGI